MNDPVDVKRRRVLATMIASLSVSPQVFAAVSTPSATEGPFYPTTPMRFADVDNDLVKIRGRVEAAGGEVVQLVGRLLDGGGRPISNAQVEIWQCDANGRYLHQGDRGSSPRDSGFQGIGIDTTDENGRYRFRTIKPVPYAGRTPHIHLKVIVAGRERLTSQLYLPDHPDNARDWLYQRIPAAKRTNVTLNFSAGSGEPTAEIDIYL